MGEKGQVECETFVKGSGLLLTVLTSSLQQGNLVLQLAHRLGMFLPRNLLGLCYLGTEGNRDTGRHYRDQKVRVIQFKVGGDIAAGSVLDCLAHMVGLFGDYKKTPC